AGTVQFRVASVQDLAGEIGAALGSVRWIGYTVFALMLVVSAAGIANSYRMVLLERTREIGMLRCIGYRRRDVFATFLAEGVLLAGGAAAAGALAGIPAGFALGFIPFNPHGDFSAALVQGHLRFLPSAGQILMIVLFETAVAAGAVLLPARKAAAVMPVEALRKTA
ncbi:MAG: FtsX-like permease family protein, partial [Rectinema sp.]|nr:FtsX-like permease family protein [Rectinema sp.]